MATIAGGLNETSFLSSLTGASDLSMLTGGILPTVVAGSTLSMTQLNPIQQWFAGSLYGTYSSLTSTLIGGSSSTLVGGSGATLSASDLATLQAYSQYYTLVAQLAFGPLLTMFGTNIV